MCVCDSNVNRSSTLEDYIRYCYPAIDVRSAGITLFALQDGSNYLDAPAVEWADRFYVMEQKHVDYLKTKYDVSSSKIVNLNILDVYMRNDLALVIEFEKRKNAGVFKELEIN